MSNEQGERIGSGVLDYLAPEPDHKCRKPLAQYPEGSLWTCDCGRRWKSVFVGRSTEWMRQQSSGYYGKIG